MILTRSQIINRKNWFSVLNEKSRSERWQDELLTFYRSLKCHIYTVVIDKYEHMGQYGESAYHPYHYCLRVMLERVRGLLALSGDVMDIMVESRGGFEDLLLRRVYRELWDFGTRYHSSAQFQQVLTSKKLKLKKKDQNVARHQIADMVAAPLKQDVLVRNGRMSAPRVTSFTQRLIKGVSPAINNYGRVLLSASK